MPAVRSSPRCSPGVRGVEPRSPARAGRRSSRSARRRRRRWPRDAEVLEVLPPDLATMDLAEAPRIVGGGAGLDGPERFAQLERRRRRARCVAGCDPRHHRPRLGRRTSARSARPASSSTRASTSPSASAAPCSTRAGSAQPDHIISVNTDRHCPMMQLADLAIVADANAVLDELATASASSRPIAGRRRDALTSTSTSSWSAPVRPGRRPPSTLARAGRERAARRARPVPGRQEHVRRRRLPADPRHAPPALVGGGADPALGHAPVHDDADRARRPSPSTTAPRPGAGRRTTAPPPTAPTSTRGWPARPRRRARCCVCSTTVDRAAARRRRARRRRAHRPARRRHHAPASSSPATASTRSSPRRPGLYGHVDPAHFTARRQGDARAAART